MCRAKNISLSILLATALLVPEAQAGNRKSKQRQQVENLESQYYGTKRVVVPGGGEDASPESTWVYVEDAQTVTRQNIEKYIRAKQHLEELEGKVKETPAEERQELFKEIMQAAMDKNIASYHSRKTIEQYEKEPPSLGGSSNTDFFNPKSLAGEPISRNSWEKIFPRNTFHTSRLV